MTDFEKQTMRDALERACVMLANHDRREVAKVMFGIVRDQGELDVATLVARTVRAANANSAGLARLGS